MANRRPSKPSNTPAAKNGNSEKTTPVTTRFPHATVTSLHIFAKEKGLLSAQEVIRLAVSSFLDKSGY